MRSTVHRVSTDGAPGVEFNTKPAAARSGRWVRHGSRVVLYERPPVSSLESELEAELESEVDRRSSDYIAWVQRSLNALASAGLDVDGQTGPLTQSAVRRFQEKHGLEVDGIVGEQTEAALIRQGAGSPPGAVAWPAPGASAPVAPVGGSSLGARAARIASEEWERWGRGSRKESDPALRTVLADYWKTGVGALPSGTSWWSDTPWSAAFISWVMKKAGAGADFKYSSSHTVYVHAAKQNREQGNAKAFKAYRISEVAPRVGDLVCQPRENSGITYDRLDGKHYASHCDVVTAVSPGSITIIGGNVGDSVSRKTLSTDAQGKLKSPFYAVVRVGDTAAAPARPAPSPPASGGLEPSGKAWVARFPTSRATTTLREPFRSNANRFIAALHAAGAKVTLNATLRPPERAYLMYHAYRIAKGLVPATAVPAQPGVNIRWAHVDSRGVYDDAASRRAAAEMVAAYGIVHAPAQRSKHIDGLAFDADITWSGPLSIVDGNGRRVTISSTPRTGADNRELHAVGASYGVRKLVGDQPHWSDSGG
jgi:hypothetical protein